MKKDGKKLMPLIAAISSILITTGICVAYFMITQSITLSGRVKATPDLAIYSDAECTVPLSSWEIPDMARGEHSDKSIWVKNIGDSNMDIEWDRELEYIEYATISMTQGGNAWAKGAKVPLAIDGVLAVVLTATIGPASPTEAAYGFDISFIGTHE